MSDTKGIIDEFQSAGLVSLIKASMVLRKKMIPPQVGVSQKRGNYPSLRNGRICVPDCPVPFSDPPDGQRRRRILVNNFDAAVRH
jgi:hypothetical protein